MDREEDIRKALDAHPCYNEEAHLKFARMHLPVAPKCNIQCNYCNRRYDCSNESRPGVTSEVLSPRQAADKVKFVLEKIPNLKVLGIAGPGDPLANEETFETLKLIKEEYPELTSCVSTNGLMLPKRAQELYDLGVRFLTVTMNAATPDVGERIYGSVIWEGHRLSGRSAAEKLIGNQKEGIRMCAELGMVVKVNIVMVPGINDVQIPELVSEVKNLGAYIVNILPLIPVAGTKFENMRAPTPSERKNMMDLCSADARMMRHCRQCRADAIGLLGEDRSSEFVHIGNCAAGCGPSKERIANITIEEPDKEEVLVAVATTDGKNVDSGFGNAKMFRIYASDGNTVRFVRDVKAIEDAPVAGQRHKDRISSTADLLEGCKAVAVSEIGHMPENVLISRGIAVVIAHTDADTAAAEAAAAVLQ
ncbi:MAG: nitrogenase cofactor biosynthesis protein NifB [Methanomassiliicoccaceae archaeon]|nr:nitrogenase cofactor biosynthesis protein NifB [Methanomassiliicoccaceae archaeon]